MASNNLNYTQQQAELLNPEKYANLVDAFDHAVKTAPDLPAYTAIGKTHTYADIERDSRKLAHYLITQSELEPGDRIAIQLPNLTQYPIAAWAAWRAGLVLVNTNPMYTPTELLHQFNDAGCRALIVLADLLPLVGKVVPDTGIELVIATNATDLLAPAPIDAEMPNLVAWQDALSGDDDCELPPINSTMDSMAVLQYTGGTTGVAKGAMLTHGNLYCAVRQGRSSFADQDKLRGGKQELTISPMPLYHVYGFTLSVVSVFITNGHSVLIPDPRNIDSLLATMKQFEFTGFAGVNTLFSAMLSHPDFDSVDFSHLDTTIAGGAATATEISEQWFARTGKPIFEGYGLTETCATATVNRLHSNVIGTVGPPNNGQNCKLVDDKGNEVAEGEEGELCLQGPNVMAGYWQRPEATAEVIDEEGWFRTGDVAIITPEGHLKIVDRIKDMILVSGFNVYPNEIEDVVYKLSGITECAVIGVPDDKTGEAVKLFVACSTEDVSADHIVTHCRQQLTAYKVPKQIEFRDELPKSNVGKILRRMLRPGAEG